MVITVGSQNQTKITAVKNITQQSELLEGAQVRGMMIDIEEFGHPKTLADTIAGAKQRAQAAFVGCTYSVGLESGLMVARDTKSGYLETTVCAIYDGKTYHIGLGPAFEWPRKMIDLILAGKDGSQAFREVGLTDHQKIGTAEGGIHVLSHGKINRTKLNELALTMALIHLENPEHY
jgi:inosine/xanthosine triphosphatase